MSTLFVDTINEKTSGNGIQIPGHPIQIVQTTLTGEFNLNHNSGSATSWTDMATVPP